MEHRPEFEEITSYSDFIRYYWYREELAAICKRLGISHTGTKQELNKTIEEYFKGHRIAPEEKTKAKHETAKITPDSPLLACGFSFNAKFREYFSHLTGVQNFKFNADMAAAWRKVKREHDENFTIKDLLDIYNHHSHYAKYDHSACEWNQFLKDFCADTRNHVYSNKLKAAAVLWKIVRESTMPKIYTYELVEENKDLIAEYKNEIGGPQENLDSPPPHGLQ